MLLDPVFSMGREHRELFTVWNPPGYTFTPSQRSLSPEYWLQPPDIITLISTLYKSLHHTHHHCLVSTRTPSCGYSLPEKQTSSSPVLQTPCKRIHLIYSVPCAILVCSVVPHTCVLLHLHHRLHGSCLPANILTIHLYEQNLFIVTHYLLLLGCYWKRC